MPDKQISHSVSEPSFLRLVNSGPCGQRVRMREAEKKRPTRLGTQKARRGKEGWRVWKVASGTWEVCGVKTLQKSDETVVVTKRSNFRGAKGLYL